MSKKEDDKLAALRRKRSIYDGIYRKLFFEHAKAHGGLGPFETCTHCVQAESELFLIIEKLKKVNEKIQELSKNEDGYQAPRARVRPDSDSVDAFKYGMLNNPLYGVMYTPPYDAAGQPINRAGYRSTSPEASIGAIGRRVDGLASRVQRLESDSYEKTPKKKRKWLF